jgi:hypothetical protein
MRRTKRLRTLGKTFEERLDRVSGAIAPYVGLVDVPSSQAVSYATIECVGAWALFAREYFLSCALLAPALRNGHTVGYPGPQLGDERAALIAAIRAVKNPNFALGPSVQLRPRDEPDWLTKATLIRISTRLQFSHDARLTSALSRQSSFFPEAVTVRNFFAHRAKESADKVRTLARRSYRSPYLNHPVEFVNTILPGRTDTLLNEWIADLKAISHALC